MRRLKWGLLISFVVLVGIVGSGLIFWISTSHSASREAQEALKKADVNNYSWYAFGANERPAPTVGVVLYPGAHVSADAYALLAQQLAKESRALVIVARVPLDLAFLDRDAATGAIEEYPNVKRWIVGGHSLGGAMAANFAQNNPEVRGLLLWASRPPREIDLSEKNLEVASIYGSQDRLIDRTSIAEAQDRLPASTRYVEIEGANHANFSDYGEQSGDDGEPTISRDEARAEIVRASSDLIEQVRSTG